MRLVDRRPHLDAPALVPRFVPPPRFGDVRFETYLPDTEHESQAAARSALEAFAAELSDARPEDRRWWQRRPTPHAGVPGISARYLDGGFGVGKTHLLAALWHEAPTPKAYLTFSELTAYIGFTGMEAAIAAFVPYRLLCVDEFELDDVANTLMVVSFLRGAMSAGLRLAVTSNTLPDRLGERRFSASDFRREITAIAAYFTELRIDGEDFRVGQGAKALPIARHDALGGGNRVSRDTFPELLAHLRGLHPVQYGALLDGVDGVVVDHLHPLTSQDDALLTVVFIDKLYDAQLPVKISGCAINELFDDHYRRGGYRKKYGRAESRLTAMAKESAGLF